LLTLFLRHTSASILIQENADPDVLADMENFFANLAPEDNSLYRHIAEGPDEMPAEELQKFHPDGRHAGAFGPKTARGRQSPSNK
jgi:thiamine phosphate synthase YjbQ (UPF0047 family)